MRQLFNYMLVVFFAYKILWLFLPKLGEAGSAGEAGKRRGKTETVAKTERDQAEVPTKIQRLAAEEEPRKGRKRKERKGRANTCFSSLKK